MTHPICGIQRIGEGGRRLICRRIRGHDEECSFSLFRAQPIRHPLEIVAQMSALLQSLPEGDYTDLVGRVYINGRTVMIEFNETNPAELVRLRKKGGH